MSKCSPFVSVVMPSFEASRTIQRAIDSVLSQTVGDLELIVVDDASRDGTPDLVETAYGAESRVKLVRVAENRGPAHARNVGFERAGGTWIGLLDADDAWRADRIETLRPLATEDCDAVFDNLVGYDFSLGTETAPLFTNFGDVQLDATALLASSVPGSALNFGYLKPLLRRSFIVDRALRYDEGLRVSEDRMFYLKLLLEGARVRCSPDALYVYTTAIGQGSGASSPLSHSVPDDRSVISALQRIAQDYQARIDGKTRTAIAECIAFMTREGPKAAFYHARAKGDLGRMLRIAAREPAVVMDVAAKAFRRMSARNAGRPS